MNKLSKALIAAAQLIDDLAIEPEMIDKIKIEADKPKITIKLHGCHADEIDERAKLVFLPALYPTIVNHEEMPNFKNRMTIADGPVVIKCNTDAY